MKKVININFQGRVIPIEETAYDILKQYVESLRHYFANEEGKDEIINDIEGRIAELFSDTLKKGSICITDDDVNVIIKSIGRPEDFEDEETKVQAKLSGDQSYGQQSTSYKQEESRSAFRGRLFRDENDKILGGVCAGIANYLRVDPAIIRILFAIITFGGFGAGFLIYILLWAILPSVKLDRGTIRKRLFRNPDDKVIAGVASGIAAYFNIAVWIPRLIFAFPLVASILISIFRNIVGHFDPGPSIVFGSFGSTFFIVYVVLWIVIPEANSASEKLEMRGEKVDLNSIRDTIQEDMGQLKTKAGKWGSEFKDKAKQFGQEFGQTVSEKGQVISSEVSAAGKRVGSRLGHAIGVIFKAFFLFIAGIIAFALLMATFGLLIGGVSVFPLKNFFLNGFWQNFLAWSTIILFLGIPVIGLLTWIIRRIIRVKSKNPYLGYIFGGLWILGLISCIFLIGSIASDYRTKTGIEEKINIIQPSQNKFYVKVSNERIKYYGGEWFGFNWDEDEAPFYGLSEDSLLLRTIQLRVVKSIDSNYHVQMVKFSHGNNPSIAEQYAKKINFPVSQTDSVLILPKGFTVTKNNKYHNQQVLVVVEVPVGKKIELDRNLNDYKWFNIEFGFNHHRGWNVDWDDNWDNNYSWNSNTEYVMTENGLKSTRPTEEDDMENDDKMQQLEKIEKQKKELEEKQKELQKSLEADSTRYRYKTIPEKTAPEKPVLPETKKATSVSINTNINSQPLNIISLLLYKLG